MNHIHNKFIHRYGLLAHALEAELIKGEAFNPPLFYSMFGRRLRLPRRQWRWKRSQRTLGNHCVHLLLRYSPLALPSRILIPHCMCVRKHYVENSELEASKD